MPEYIKTEEDEAYDYLNEMWKRVEDKLVQINCPIAAWVDFKTEDGPESLGLCRRKGKWRICHLTGFITTSHTITPILECSLSVRVAMSSKIAALERAILQAKKDFGPQVEKAIRLMERFWKEDVG